MMSPAFGVMSPTSCVVSPASGENLLATGRQSGGSKNEFGIGILIRGDEKTSLAQGFSLEGTKKRFWHKDSHSETKIRQENLESMYPAFDLRQENSKRKSDRKIWRSCTRKLEICKKAAFSCLFDTCSAYIFVNLPLCVSFSSLFSSFSSFFCERLLSRAYFQMQKPIFCKISYIFLIYSYILLYFQSIFLYFAMLSYVFQVFSASNIFGCRVRRL